MKKLLLIIVTTVFFPGSMGWAQQWESVLSIENRLGYSTNTYLNPYMSEWEVEPASLYDLTAVSARANGYQKRFSWSVTGSAHYQAFLQNGVPTWKGAVLWGNLDHPLTANLTLGINSGVSYLSGSFDRTIAWLQPRLTWFITPFTLVRAKAGSNMQQYSGTTSGSRYDSYALEAESWLTYRLQLTAGLYSDLNSFPSLSEGYNGVISAQYRFRNNSSIQAFVGLQQYQFETTIDGSGGGAMTQPGSNVLLNTDRLLRYGISAQRPINNRFSLFANVEVLHYLADVAINSSSDIKTSAGLRFSLEPRFKKDEQLIEPDWNIDESRQKLRVRYVGEGRLYLVGSFNNWEKPGIPLRRQNQHWLTADLQLEPGMYEYRILRIQGKDEEWLDFSKQTYTVQDDFDGNNALIVIDY
ncbi:MAG: glycogen-binding domain-containing protein [Bacteroidota bacterium]